MLSRARAVDRRLVIFLRNTVAGITGSLKTVPGEI